MSRTKKHPKQNKDYWTARPGNKGGGAYNSSPHGGSTEQKKRTASMERTEDKKEIKNQLEELVFNSKLFKLEEAYEMDFDSPAAIKCGGNMTIMIEGAILLEKKDYHTKKLLQIIEKIPFMTAAEYVRSLEKLIVVVKR